MKVAILLLALSSTLSGCAAFKPPSQRGGGATVPTGQYDSAAEKWSDEARSAQRKAQKEKTEKELDRMERK